MVLNGCAAVLNWWQRLLTQVILFIPGAVLGVYVFQEYHGASQNPRPPAADDTRMFLPSGSSIVKPPDWKGSIYADEKSDFGDLSFSPGGMSRHSPWMSVSGAFEKPNDDVSGWKKCLFNGREAFHVVLGQGGENARTAFCWWVRCDKGWFSISYSRSGYWPDGDAPIPEGIMGYLNTFSCGDNRSALGSE